MFLEQGEGGVMWFPDRLRATLWRCQFMVWAAGWFVPGSDRALWRLTQNRKFWHWGHFLVESGQLTTQNRLIIARKCWTLFAEAFWLRFNRERFHAKLRRTLGSPVPFLAAVSMVALALLFGSGIITAGRIAFSAPTPHAERVALITLDGSGINGKFSRTRSDTLLDLASIWGKSRLADGLTPFSWAPSHLLSAQRELSVATARVGPEFFDTLGVKPALGRGFAPEDSHACPSCVLLSDSVWHHEFHGDLNIVGKTVALNGAPCLVIGVLPASFRLISPGIAVWGLIDPAMLFTNFQRRVGAVARLSGDATPEQLQRDLTDLTESAGYVHPSSQLKVVTVAAQVRRDFTSTLWFILLVTGCAVLVVVLRRSSDRIGRLPDGRIARVVWLGFFGMKSALLLTVAGLTSWWLVHAVANWTAGSTYPLVDEYSVWLFLPLAIVALSWSVRDQQRRCRTCLQRLELPVEVGLTGSVLLNWAGTEMVCSAGHGVLYLPDSLENSMDQDRWNKLDESWEDLFRAG